MESSYSSLNIGILAIQGAIEEHALCVQRLGARASLIKLPKDFEGLDGIILPGGESTAMAIVGEEYGLFPKLKEWVQLKKPIWGTCAGMILLSDHAIKQKSGGQSLVGGLDVHVCRNFFGPQINSCKVDVDIPISSETAVEENSPYPAVFIRAPAIIKIGPGVTKLAELVAKPHPSARKEVRLLLESEDLSNEKKIDLGENDEIKVIIAAQQGTILATAFHPELTNDLRFHRYFLDMVKSYNGVQL